MKGLGNVDMCFSTTFGEDLPTGHVYLPLEIPHRKVSCCNYLAEVRLDFELRLLAATISLTSTFPLERPK